MIKAFVIWNYDAYLKIESLCLFFVHKIVYPLSHLFISKSNHCKRLSSRKLWWQQKEKKKYYNYWCCYWLLILVAVQVGQVEKRHSNVKIKRKEMEATAATQPPIPLRSSSLPLFSFLSYPLFLSPHCNMPTFAFTSAEIGKSGKSQFIISYLMCLNGNPSVGFYWAYPRSILGRKRREQGSMKSVLHNNEH